MGDSGKGGQQGPFSFGPSQFDLQAILDALGQGSTAITNRYNQLGLGNSTMLQQDLSQNNLQASAVTGEEQNTSVTNPALNPALQPPSAVSPSGALSSLGSLASSAGKILGGGSSGATGTGTTSPTVGG